MSIKTLKIAGLSIMAIGLTAGAAWAGGGKDCKDKGHTTAAKTETTMTPSTAVLNASDTTKTKAKKVYTFEQAMEKCQAKGVDDLQACIDYKTGKTKVKPTS